MTDARGRNRAGVNTPFIFKNRRSLNAKDKSLLQKWKKLPMKDKEIWGYNFDKYRKGSGETS